MRGVNGLRSEESALSVCTQKPERPTGINPPRLAAQTGYNVLDFRAFFPLLVPALLDDFPHTRGKTQL